MIRIADLKPGAAILDVATGTGDMMIEALRQQPGARAIGSDFTFEMMQAGQGKPGAQPIRWCAADALHLPFRDETFDAVTSAFGCATSSIVRPPFASKGVCCGPGGE